jgi:Ca-activated chloride channel family protein
MNAMGIAARTAITVFLMTGTQLALAATAAAASDLPTASLWSRLWRTPDQRGQALLQQGDAAGAAQVFADPQQKAHAALQAHDYSAAVQALTGIDTAEAHYNRGNALGHTGDLPGAIRAYDAALKHNFQHADARHNRDVVAAALQKQKEGSNDTSKQDLQQSGKAGSKASDKKEEKQDGKGGEPDQPSKAEKSGKSETELGDKANGKQNGKDGKDGKSDAKPGDGNRGKGSAQANDSSADKSGEKLGQKPNQKSADPSTQPNAVKRGESATSTSQPATATAPTTAAAHPKDDAAQARRDAESAVSKGAQPPTKTENGASEPTQGREGTANAAKLPLSEKQVAQEQWLRAIPDDPGGLLRRKFLIEHLLRQQGRKP